MGPKLTPEQAGRLSEALDALYDIVQQATDPDAAGMIRIPQVLMKEIDTICDEAGYTKAEVVTRGLNLFVQEYERAKAL